MYQIQGKDGWEIVNDGVVIAKITGGMSLAVALAACEKLNSDFDFRGWTVRAAELFVEEEATNL